MVVSMSQKWKLSSDKNFSSVLSMQFPKNPEQCAKHWTPSGIFVQWVNELKAEGTAKRKGHFSCPYVKLSKYSEFLFFKSLLQTIYICHLPPSIIHSII